MLALGPDGIVTRDRLTTLEEEIEAAPDNLSVGRALAEIKNQRLYKPAFTAFEAYYLQRWGKKRERAYQLIEAYETAQYLAQHGLSIQNERQARELTGIPREKQVEVIRSLQSRSIKPSAANIRREVESLHLDRQKRKSATPKSKPRSTALSPTDKAAVAHRALNSRRSYAEIAKELGLHETAVRRFMRYDKAFIALREEHERQAIETSYRLRRGELKLEFTEMNGRPHAVLYDPRDPAGLAEQLLYLKNVYRDAEGRTPTYFISTKLKTSPYILVNSFD
jgi:predicted kinase